MEKENKGIFDGILKAIGLKKDDPKKSDFVEQDVDDLIKTLELAKSKGGLEQQSYGNMTYQKEVESLQIALSILAEKDGKPNPLPIHGIDGLFGPETARAVKDFVSETEKIQELFFVSKKQLSKLLKEMEMVQLNQTNYSNVDHDNDHTATDSVNKALLDDIQTAASNAGVQVTITTAMSGHPSLNSGRDSRHKKQTAVDIAIINGVSSGGATNSKNGNPKFREDGNKLVAELVKMGYSLNNEVGHDKAVIWQSDVGGNHYNHVHVSNRVGVPSDYQPIISSTPSKLVKKTSSGKLLVTPEMIDKIISKLKDERVEDTDLTKYVDEPINQTSFSFGESKNPRIEAEGISLRSYPSDIMDQFKKVAGDNYDKFINDVKSIGLNPLTAVRQLYTESGFSNDVITCKKKSSAGAMGLAQFIPSTWESYGTGSPCNVKDSLDAYVKFMDKLLNRFPGRPDLAVAAYNSGPNLKVYQEALQNNLSFETLKGKIPSETFRYSASIFQA